MFTPHVTEIPPRMAPVTRDEFAGPSRRLDERLARARRLNLVRAELRTRRARPSGTPQAP
jgi:hypothetical protein